MLGWSTGPEQRLADRGLVVVAEVVCRDDRGKQIVSHAKLVAIDHKVVLLASANFSFSAENRNIEWGLRIRDSALAESVEATMTSNHGSLHELA